jgi:hypothetical protein
MERGKINDVHLIESSPAGGGLARLHSRPHGFPGDIFPRYESFIFDVETKTGRKIDAESFESEREKPAIFWDQAGKRCMWVQVDRGHQRLRLIQVDVATGRVNNMIDERSETFIWTSHTPSGIGHWLPKRDLFLYISERTGWRHLYAVDVTTGETKAITQGDWVVRGIEYVDEENSELWFRASGVFPGQDPYFVHYGRAKLDGSEVTFLTEGNGTHTNQPSPDRNYIIDTYSRVDLAPVTELRRCKDGKLVCNLEQADTSELLADGWKAPEVFVAKGRDGKTDIWGLITSPPHLNGQKYAVVENIYAGPPDTQVPKSFNPELQYTEWTKLGFVVVEIDGMGTAHRSKAFHDVAWKNLKDAGLPDRILWMKAAAKKFPFMDLARVGIFWGVGWRAECGRGGLMAIRVLQSSSSKLRLSRQPNG